MMRLIAAALASAALASSALATDAATDAAISARIAQIRALPAAANAATAGAQRRELDSAWRFFGDVREDAIPLLRRELAAELRAARPSQQLLLDAACFLLAYGADSDRPLALQAALAINPDALLDRPQLFRLMHAAAASRDVRLLPLIDRAFLRHDVSIPLPQQGSSIDETGVRALLYGRFGLAGERHLAAQLRDGALTKPVLDVLQLLGSPDSTPAVAPLLQNQDMDVLTRAAGFLMHNGGPQGRQALLALKLQGLPKAAVEFLAPMRQQLMQSPAPQVGQGALPDAEVRRQLDALEAANGSYDGVDPAAIARSRLPKQELLERLGRIRERSFARPTNEALADIETTSALLNAVSYRDH
ncbi:hypothetical protein [Pseudoduganella violaceinigra]|uniref:hypothetical protein n=1 Tax=Pseudoduganella violaceinigra TaxID=246602 RepID=UPI00041C8610|nr:hypothetical protein [Pseudoduganella violaceinigra]